MRNGKHYVSVRLTKKDKDRFDTQQQICGLTKRTMLYHLSNGNVLGEKYQKEYLRLNRLLLRLDINMGHLWLTNRIDSEITKDKYYHLSKDFNRVNCEILDKLLLKDPYYGTEKTNEERKTNEN